jgi:hypothetical protein
MQFEVMMLRPTLPTTAFAAALALSALAVHADEPRAAVSDEQMAEARRQFQAGVNLLDDPEGARYEDAYRAFKKAHTLSKSSKVLGNIGFCALHLERDGEAIDAYRTYLREAPDVDERERAQIITDIVTLTSTTARVKLTVVPPGTWMVLVDTRLQMRGPAIENTYPFDSRELALRLRPGRHVLKVKSADRESTVSEVTLDPGSDVSVSLAFALKEAPPPLPPPRLVERPSAAGPIILGAAGLLGLGAGIAAGLRARATTNDIESACPNDLCPSQYDLASQRGEAKTFGTIADVSLISGGILLGGAILWYALQSKPVPSRMGGL